MDSAMEMVDSLGNETGGTLANETTRITSDSRANYDNDFLERFEPLPKATSLPVLPPPWMVEGEKESKEILGFGSLPITFDRGSHSELASSLGEGTDDDAGSDISEKRVLSKVVKSNSHDLEIRDSSDEVIFGGNDFNDFLHENGASVDVFSDALDESIDAEGLQSMDNMPYHVNIQDWLYKKQGQELRYSQELLGYLEHSEVIKGTGRPDLYEDGDEIDALDVSGRQSISSDECFHSLHHDSCSRLSLGSKSGRHSSEYGDQQQKEYDVELDPDSNRIRYVYPASPILIRATPQTLPTQCSIATSNDAEPVQAQFQNFDAVAFEQSEGVFNSRQAAIEDGLIPERGNGPLQEKEKGDCSEEDQCLKILLPGFQKNVIVDSEASIQRPLAMIHRVVDPGDIDHEFGMHEENKLVVRPVTIADTRDVHAVEGDAEDFSLEIGNECTMRSGSKDSEKLLQLDVSSHWVRPPQLQVRGANSLHQDTESRSGIGWRKEDLGPDELSRYVEALELKESYVDTVLDMEDVLLNFDDSDGSYYHMVSKGLSLVHPPHDPDNLNAPIFAGNKHQGSLSNSLKVDAIEVIGARQKSGGTSISERVVGVKEHTVYNIKVRAAAKEWEVERRYRDFVDLYRQLKKILVSQMGLSLPASWGKVDMESRKFIGNTSPDVIEVRSVLLQVCLQSLLEAGPPLSTAAPLLRFLSLPSSSCQPFDSVPNTHAAKSPNEYGQNQLQLKELNLSLATRPALEPGRSRAEVGEHDVAKFSVFGKTIRLIVKMHPVKPLKQQLAVQHNACAGCYGQLDSATGFVSGIATTLGLGGPRLCDYSGQLFCMKCHLNETAVIPARVLQMWDFTPRRVSQLAKAYLDSIYDQPMLCVSAVNPFLYSRVPILAHVRDMRRKLSKMFNCVHCPSRSSFQQMVGSRRHLFEDNDFFALHDLEDLSKGAFSVLPGLLDMISNKLLLHISKKCSVCQEVAEPCAGGLFCAYPSSMLFPFEEQKIHRCTTCHSPFHEDCFKKCGSCRVCNLDQLSSVTVEDCPGYNAKSKASSSSQRDDDDSQSSCGMESDDKISVQEDDRPKPSKYLARLFGSRESQRERQKQRRTAKILNMTAILGPLEL